MGKYKETILLELGGPKGLVITTELLKIGGFGFVIWKLIVFGGLALAINWVIEQCDDGSGKKRKKRKGKR